MDCVNLKDCPKDTYMEQDKDRESPNSKDTEKGKDKSWVEKAEDWMDETAEKIHESETYQKADKKVEDVTKKLFRKAGRWWGKL